MAYRAVDEWSLATASYSTPSAASIAVFDGVERQVIALARHDDRWSLLEVSDWRARIVRWLSGRRPVNRLANARLETLRRFAILARVKRGRVGDAEIQSFLEAGFTAVQAALLQRDHARA